MTTDETTPTLDEASNPARDLETTDEMPITAMSIDQPPAAFVDGVAPDTSFAQRYLGAIVGAFALALLAAFTLIAVLFAQLSSTRDDLDTATESLETSTDDLARVEAGAALFASQVTGFQEQITELQPTIQDGLDEAVTGLKTFSESTLEFTVNIDESVDINTEVVLDRTIEVPIEATLPIDETFDTTITIDGPFGTEIPLDITVPVKIDVPIDLTIDIPINETVPIETNVPVKIDVPIGVNIADTQLADLATSLALGLESFTDVLDGLGG